MYPLVVTDKLSIIIGYLPNYLHTTKSDQFNHLFFALNMAFKFFNQFKSLKLKTEPENPGHPLTIIRDIDFNCNEIAIKF